MYRLSDPLRNPLLKLGCDSSIKQALCRTYQRPQQLPQQLLQPVIELGTAVGVRQSGGYAKTPADRSACKPGSGLPGGSGGSWSPGCGPRTARSRAGSEPDRHTVGFVLGSVRGPPPGV